MLELVNHAGDFLDSGVDKSCNLEEAVERTKLTTTPFFQSNLSLYVINVKTRYRLDLVQQTHQHHTRCDLFVRIPT